VAPAVIDVVGGHVPMLIVSVPSVLPQVKAGRLRALAVTSPQRSQFTPDLPTVAEAGVPGYEAQQWWGVFAPGKTPRPIVGRLSGEIHKILASEDVKVRLADAAADEPANGDVARPDVGIKCGEVLLRLDDDAAPALQVEPERDVVGDRVPGTDVDVEPVGLTGEQARQMVILEVLRVG